MFGGKVKFHADTLAREMWTLQFFSFLFFFLLAIDKQHQNNSLSFRLFNLKPQSLTEITIISMASFHQKKTI